MTAADVAALAGEEIRGVRARLFDRLLSGLAVGRLRVILPSGESFVRAGRLTGPEATIQIRRWRTLTRILTGGDIGFAEGYVAGDWISPDPVAVIRLAARNTDDLRRAVRGSRLFRSVDRLRHLLNANSRRGSRRNIEAHYDLGNDFYRRWLDGTMLYSSALWDETTPSLEAAQTKKLDRIAELLALDGGESVLEIGCGWGALAAHLAEDRAGRVTGLTLSPSQLAWARDVAAVRGLADRVDLRLQDYRDVVETFDRVVSIEMFEAVGEAWWPTYFETLARALNPGGRAVLQVISIADDRYEDYRRDTDFIQKHVFPGGFLPSKSAFAAAVAAAGLRLEAAEHFGLSYAETLAEWRRRFHARWEEIAPLGFDARFRRLWDYYLAYCEAGFREGAIDVGLYTLTKSETAAGGRS
ncbi:SAM-dependent methyltransferase [Pinisolibacter aquiterrae]|uniref:SAM-dependent methyltransferase n=1 Tax=Pinisolibacter aquiterrae TaxID=2815579 RepID=UPI001C3E1412|nr:cyclopropane-fatty-acyl-phospholipid synthase family protein [Pinisolibacter aquiterrae]MBV5263853.1 class I SAM-dependent methyltransferase [Pinisolibacter aquiterrae]MCC8237246.1 cyclopropane-fatty-acyl-phospholipid synthase family protein [Pinisolibacter aquiterrae]